MIMFLVCFWKWTTLNIFCAIYFVDEAQLLENGKHVYPFNFSLPHKLPSTFNEYNGHVRYTVKVIIDIPQGISEKSKKIFKVFSPINLKHELMLAVSGHNKDYIFCVRQLFDWKLINIA